MRVIAKAISAEKGDEERAKSLLNWLTYYGLIDKEKVKDLNSYNLNIKINNKGAVSYSLEIED